MIGVSRPVVKHNLSVRHPEEIPEVIRKAYYIASTGRPGPVVVDIPKDMTTPNERYEYSYPKKVKLRSYNPAVRGHAGQIKKAVDMLMAAKRPIIYADRKSTRLNSSHVRISYAVFCLKKKKK